MNLRDYLSDRCQGSGLDPDDLRELLVRLLNYGVLCREESQTERELYDRFLRLEPLVREILDLFAIRIHHDRRFEYVRLYPPGAQTPGMEGSEEQAFAGSLRARLSQIEVALLLVLRAQYDKALREGKVDEQGAAAESLESLGIAHRSLLGRPLPDKLTERKRGFQRLKALRLVDYRQEEDLESGEAWLRIQPMIVDFVSAEALALLREGDGSAVPEPEAEPAAEGEMAEAALPARPRALPAATGTRARSGAPLPPATAAAAAAAGSDAAPAAPALPTPAAPANDAAPADDAAPARRGRAARAGARRSPPASPTAAAVAAPPAQGAPPKGRQPAEEKQAPAGDRKARPRGAPKDSPQESPATAAAAPARRRAGATPAPAGAKPKTAAGPGTAPKGAAPGDRPAEAKAASKKGGKPSATATATPRNPPRPAGKRPRPAPKPSKKSR